MGLVGNVEKAGQVLLVLGQPMLQLVPNLRVVSVVRRLHVNPAGEPLWLVSQVHAEAVLAQAQHEFACIGVPIAAGRVPAERGEEQE